MKDFGSGADCQLAVHRGDGPQALVNARMGMVAGIITATGGCMFSGGRATLQAAGNVKLNAHGVPIDGRAGWTVQHAAQACRNLKDNQTQACSLCSVNRSNERRLAAQVGRLSAVFQAVV